ncbi:MAG TPA: DUF2889 domain-containing protein [Paenalcaligenes sp.]|nr:DUF2889 domain-containing protein [Paenalcaligenes sp.]
MSSSTHKVARTPLHNRSVVSQVFERDDGLWDLEATLIDTKSYDFTFRDGTVWPAGYPIHHMQICVTVDDQYNIVNATAAYEDAPYNEHCSSIAEAYRGLIGLNLLRGFRHAVRERFKRTAGCTHMTELCQVLPTLAVQGVGTRVARRDPDPNRKPFAVGGCHALREDGEIVKEYYPKWYTGHSAKSGAE